MFRTTFSVMFTFSFTVIMFATSNFRKGGSLFKFLGCCRQNNVNIFTRTKISRSRLAWWIGACIMAIVEEPFKLVTMVAIIVVGWIVPGLILNKQYKKRSVK